MENFESEHSNDSLKIKVINRSHKAEFEISKFDDLNENMKLLGNVLEYLKNNDIKWIIVEYNKSYTFPVNTIFKINPNNKLLCHIEDFEKFYVENISKMLKMRNIHVGSTDEKNNGWTLVINKKKEKQKKIIDIDKEIKSLTSDWNKL